MLSTSKNIWGFDPRSVPGCVLWLDAADNSTMNSTTTVTQWNDKSGQSNTMTGTATWNGTTMTFNGSTQAFSNLTFTFPYASFSLFGVYSNTTAPAATAYMNAAYAGGGYPMIGTYDVNKFVTARGVVGNTGAVVSTWVTMTTTAVLYSVATDSTGNVFVCGIYNSAATLYNTSGTAGATLPFTGGYDAAIAKYSPSGSVLWAARIASLSNDNAQAVATDSGGNVFVIGQYGAALTLYNADGTTGATLPFTAVNDCFVAKYSSAGAVVWAAQIAGTGSESGGGVATDTSGNVFVTGSYTAALTLYNTGGGTGATLAFAGGNSCFLAKYTSAGAVVWATRMSGTGSTSVAGQGVATDSSGNVYVTGNYNGAITLYNTSGTTGATFSYASGIAFDGYTAKYSSAGAVVWAARYTTFGQGGRLGYITTDSGGNVYVAGYYNNTFTLYNASGVSSATLPTTSSTRTDGFIVKFTSAGAVSWAAQIAGSGTTGQNAVTSVATDSSSNVYVCGYYVSLPTFYNTGGTAGPALPFTGGTDGFLAKYSSTGTVTWAAQFTSPGASNDVGYGVAIDSSGNAYVCGTCGSPLTLYNTSGTAGAIVGFVASACFIAKYSPTGYAASGTPASSNVLVDATYTGTTLSPYVNGSNQTTLSATTVAATGFYVGGPSNYFNGSVSELLIYNNTLTSNQRSAVEGYLASKWGVKSKLPTTHPFYVTPAFNRAFSPTDVPTCALWLDASDNSTMNSTTTVTTWNDKSGLGNTMTGTATWTGSNMTFNGSTQAFSNTSVVFPYTNFSMFGVYSNTTAPAASAYMNVMYATGGYPMIGTYDVSKLVTARGVVGNTGALFSSLYWAIQMGSSGQPNSGIATDSSGNVYMCGLSADTLRPVFLNVGGSIGLTLPYAPGGGSAWLVKYSSNGLVLWGVQFVNTGTAYPNAFGTATDSSGNVFVTGFYVSGTLTLYNADTTAGATLASSVTAGNTSGFIAKYSSSGSLTWAARFIAATTVTGQGVATDSGGNVFAIGWYGGALTLYNTGGTIGASLPLAGTYAGFLVKYSSSGTVLWAAQISAGSYVQGFGVATDSSGNVFVIGQYSGALTLYNSGATSSKTVPFTGGADCFLAKYSSDGTSVMWAARIAGTTTSGDVGYGIATDSSGNVFVTGRYTAALTLYNSGATQTKTLAFTGVVDDCFLAKYSSDGTSVMWAARIVGASTTTGQAVATDSGGNVYVTGQFQGALTVYNSGETSSIVLSSIGVYNMFIAKYSSDGSSAMWATRCTNAQGFGVVTDPSGNVCVTGYAPQGSSALYNTGGTLVAILPVPSASSTVFLCKYNSNGYVVGSVTAASSNVLVDATYTGTTLSPYISGSNQTSKTATTAAATGIYVGGPTNYFNGSISELLVYGSSLTAAQRQQVEGYLTQKWGLGSQVVSTHPYKTIPPSISLPAQYYEVTPGNWARDWQPYLQSLAAANSSGITYTTTNITGGATYTANGWYGGGVIAPDGNIYFAPYAAANILKLTVATGQTTNITGGATFTSSGWCGGVLGPDGNVYFTPLNALNILKLNPTTGVTTNITGGATYVSLGWLGGVVGPDSNIYFTPYNATNILKLNPFTGVTTNITGGATFTGTAKWNGGVLGPDGNMYFAPGGTTTILKLNVATGQTTNITGGASFIAGSNWVGGVLAPDGNIYFSPYTAANFLKLNVATGVTTNITGSATYVSTGWLGSVLGPDGNMYCAPANASNILQLNVATGATSNITGGASFTGNGKWLGGTLAFDGSIYFTPIGAANILKLSFTGLSRLPSSNYCLSAWANKF